MTQWLDGRAIAAALGGGERTTRAASQVGRAFPGGGAGGRRPHRPGMCARSAHRPAGGYDVRVQALEATCAADAGAVGGAAAPTRRCTASLCSSRCPAYAAGRGARSARPAQGRRRAAPYNAGLLAQGRTEAYAGPPLGGVELLRRAGLPIVGQHAVVVGRSAVGPSTGALAARRARHRRRHTHPRSGASSRARPISWRWRPAGADHAEMVRPGAVVLDFGANDVGGQMTGDVAPNVADVAGWLTPVPGGTGPMTNAMLSRNLVAAAEQQLA